MTAKELLSAAHPDCVTSETLTNVNARLAIDKQYHAKFHAEFLPDGNIALYTGALWPIAFVGTLEDAEKFAKTYQPPAPAYQQRPKSPVSTTDLDDLLKDLDI